MVEALKVPDQKVEFPQVIKERSWAVLDSMLLINPGTNKNLGMPGMFRTEPLGLEYVASSVRPLVREIDIYDCRFGEEENPGGLIAALENRGRGRDFVGISCNFTIDVPNVRELAKQIRERVGKDIPIVVGGHHISVRPKDLYIPEVDAIAVGPGEKPIRDMTRAWAEKHSFENVENVIYRDKNGNFKEKNAHLLREATMVIVDASERFVPSRDLTDKYRKSDEGYYLLDKDDIYLAETSTGCVNHCTFCSVWIFNGGRYANEPLERTINQLKRIPDGSNVFLVDDLAFHDVEKTRKLIKWLKGSGKNFNILAQMSAGDLYPENEEERKIKQALILDLMSVGLKRVLVGIESFDPEDLKKIHKASNVEQNIKALEFAKSIGLEVHAAEIYFHWWVEKNAKHAVKMNNDLGVVIVQVTRLTPLPGTIDFRKAINEGEITEDNYDPSLFDLYHRIKKTALSPEEDDKLFHWVQQQIGFMSRRTLNMGIERGMWTREKAMKMLARYKRELRENENVKAQAEEKVVFEDVKT